MDSPEANLEMRFGGDALIGRCSRRPWKGSREVGPAKKAARKAASLSEGDLRGQRGPQGEVAAVFRRRPGWSQALWLFSVSRKRRPAARGQLGKAGLAIERERPPSWLQETWTEP